MHCIFVTRYVIIITWESCSVCESEQIQSPQELDSHSNWHVLTLINLCSDTMFYAQCLLQILLVQFSFCITTCILCCGPHWPNVILYFHCFLRDMFFSESFCITCRGKHCISSIENILKKHLLLISVYPLLITFLYHKIPLIASPIDNFPSQDCWLTAACYVNISTTVPPYPHVDNTPCIPPLTVLWQ